MKTPIQPLDELVNYINAQNALWVSAARRLSRRLLIELLRYTGQHLARELTEYWTHHQHIWDAVGRNSLKEPRYMQPVLATFVHALSSSECPDGYTHQVRDRWRR